jgi:hypothetical protein
MLPTNDKDGGGVRGYSTLLILEALMANIKTIEMQYSPSATSSAWPFMPFLDKQDGGASKRPHSSYNTHAMESVEQQLSSSSIQIFPRQRRASAPTSDPARPRSQFLPCHYFDYIAGTSTGG